MSNAEKEKRLRKFSRSSRKKLEIYRIIYVELYSRDRNDNLLVLLEEAFVAVKKMINKVRQYILGEDNDWYERNKARGGELTSPPIITKKRKIEIKKKKRIFTDNDNYPRYTICNIQREIGKDLADRDPDDELLEYIEEVYVFGKKLSNILKREFKAKSFYGKYWPKNLK